MIILSFDIEEFDMPFEYGKAITFEEQIDISAKGSLHILDMLQKHQVKATFFSTAIFAMNAPAVIERILKEGHELASHGYYHSEFDLSHMASSKAVLEKLSGKEIFGFRMARMKHVDGHDVAEAGYRYNSSVSPTWLPGRYNNLRKPRRYYKEKGIWQIPASVSPLIRFPLFWLSFHNLPLRIYQWLAKLSLRKDGYLNIYFHPWEFTDLKNRERFGFPHYIERNTGEQMIQRMDTFIQSLKLEGHRFCTMSEFVSFIDGKSFST